MDEEHDFEDFGGFEVIFYGGFVTIHYLMLFFKAADPVEPAEAQPVAAGNAEASPSPWALYAAAAPGYQASQPDVIQPPVSAASVPNVVAEHSRGTSAGAGSSGAEESNVAYFDANFDDFCLDDVRVSVIYIYGMICMIFKQ
jgi:hypothetical protein